MTRSTDIQREELWVFPMQFPLHVVAEADPSLRDRIAALIARHVPGVPASSLTLTPSSRGRYVSVRAVIEVTHKDQINGLYADLAAEPGVRMAL